MADHEDDWVRKRAYSLWEEEGYPAGKDLEHWERAKRELDSFKPGRMKRATSRPAAASAKPASIKPEGASIKPEGKGSEALPPPPKKKAARTKKTTSS
ncbi:conserved protein of unknown function [Pseudorhizobium banfieldiae]|uniref:DUF2934 domain-containing protein n=1 Tax=Pseudorhizobium banfieldiae TaxID=1125847 RepID=L0NIL1_9HYPH|nr:DUF2934 domain-containing protein [Pseudorhizobium banfieldiae]CAD6616935.1 hypothetical protein RNT25_03244 [arsenite-oxidising bacterium NT-25]CCF20636.1 conserved protein of unknown function [Pseudorhizobium banfieldiae]